MYIMKLSIRNIFRHYRSNLIISFIVFPISFFLFILISFADGGIQNIRKGVAGFYYPCSDLKIVSSSYAAKHDRNDSTLDQTINNTSELVEQLASLPKVEEAVPYVWPAYASVYVKGIKYNGISFLAYSSNDNTLKAMYAIAEGRNFNLNESGKILLHYKIKQATNTRIDDDILVVGNDLFGQVSSLRVKVIGFFKPCIDNPNIYNTSLLSQRDLSFFQGYDFDEVNQILIRTKGGGGLNEALISIKQWTLKKNKAYIVYESSLEQQDYFYLKIYRSIRRVIVVLILLVLLITSVGIINILALDLIQRRKEIAIYYCLGVEVQDLITAYCLELSIVVLFSTLIGIGLGHITILIFNCLKIVSSDPGFQIIAGGSRLTLCSTVLSNLLIVIGLLVITLISSIIIIKTALQNTPIINTRELD